MDSVTTEDFYDKCIWCDKQMCAIGHRRSNGADHKDWLQRSSHKHCWIENELKRALPRPLVVPKKMVVINLD